MSKQSRSHTPQKIPFPNPLPPRIPATPRQLLPLRQTLLRRGALSREVNALLVYGDLFWQEGAERGLFFLVFEALFFRHFCDALEFHGGRYMAAQMAGGCSAHMDGRMGCIPLRPVLPTPPKGPSPPLGSNTPHSQSGYSSSSFATTGGAPFT